MPVSFEFGGTCRDIDLLPEEERDLRGFFEGKIAPAIWEDFSKTLRMARGNGVDFNRDYDAELEKRGCEVGGKLVITF